MDAALIDQFKDAYTFDTLWLSESESKLLQQTQQGHTYFLVDTSGNVRQYYDADDKSTLTRLVEDIALILPHRKSKDILLKSNPLQDEN